MNTRERIYQKLSDIALGEFSDLVEGVRFVEGKLRIFLNDNSVMDIWISEKRKGVYAYHWERKLIDGTIYRHNNIPDREARQLKTFPKHFHKEKEENIAESEISDVPEEALRSFLLFAREVIKRK
ncbi:MAG: DUF6516 family protein [Candidatus Edwardsbacteria bacterium]